MIETETKDKLGLLYLFIFIVVLLWLINLLIFLPYMKEFKMNGVGEVGDIFGAANSLFSGLAMAGIIFTILLQKKELNLQRAELKATREEFVQQNSTLKLQRFENTFFQLLRLHQDNATNMHIKFKVPNPKFYNPYEDSSTIEIEKHGKTAFSDLKKQLTSIFLMHDLVEQEPDNSDIIFFESAKNAISACYAKFDQQNNTYISHYFNTLGEIMRFIHKAKELNEDEKKFYLKIVKAQLSKDEIFIFCYYSFTPQFGNPMIKFIVDKYSFLNYQDFDNKILHKNIYDMNKIKIDPN